MDGNNRFGPTERALLLGVTGVGPTVIGRLEQLGYHTLAYHTLACAHLAADAATGGNG